MELNNHLMEVFSVQTRYLRCMATPPPPTHTIPKTRDDGKEVLHTLSDKIYLVQAML